MLEDKHSGVQPMMFQDHIIVFNGEIYNHKSLRPKILGKHSMPFQGHSDTETLLRGFVAFGADFVSQLEGEFAFVIVTRDGKNLWASRDPYGVKPLFFAFPEYDTSKFAIAHNRYDFVSHSIHFASEVKALPITKHWNREGLLRQFVG